jgi:hypothetical protein
LSAIRIAVAIGAVTMLAGCQDILGLETPIPAPAVDAMIADGANTVDARSAPDAEIADTAPPAEDCQDRLDNDDDGAFDCEDADCAGDPVCPPPTVMITEVVDHAEMASIKYVEVYNATAAPIDLTGWQIRRHSNMGVQQDLDLPSVALAPGDLLIAASLAPDFESEYLFPPDIANNLVINGNGNDAYELFNGKAVIDVYGEPGLDGTGLAWEYTDSVAKRVRGVVAGRAVWDASEWAITLGSGEANPGSRD